MQDLGQGFLRHCGPFSRRLGGVSLQGENRLRGLLTRLTGIFWTQIP